MKQKDILQDHKALPPQPHARRIHRLSRSIWLAARASILTVLVAGSSLAQFEGGGGPSILSRGGARPGQAGGLPISFNFYAGINGYYNAGAIPIDPGSGSAQTLNLYGASVSGGVTGTHLWKRSSFGMDYRGSYHRYNTHPYQDGTEQAIDMQYQIQAGRRFVFRFSE